MKEFHRGPYGEHVLLDDEQWAGVKMMMVGRRDESALPANAGTLGNFFGVPVYVDHCPCPDE